LSRRTKRRTRWWKAARLVAKTQAAAAAARAGPAERRPPPARPGGACQGRRHPLALDDARRLAHVVRTPHLSQSRRAAGPAAFRPAHGYKAAGGGKQVVVVEDPMCTTQDGAACGVRRAACPRGCVGAPRSVPAMAASGPSSPCRAHPAALNLLRAGQARRGAEALVSVLQRAAPGFSR